MFADQCKRIGSDIRFGLKDIDHDKDERSYEAEEQKEQHDPHDCVHYFLFSCGFFIISHYAATSPFLPM